MDNFIPDFNPQDELEAFMDTIGDDFKEFSGFGGSENKARPPRQRPTVKPIIPFKRPTPLIRGPSKSNFR